MNIVGDGNNNLNDQKELIRAAAKTGKLNA